MSLPDPFRHGVASGDPTPHQVVLWTRVTPTEAAQPGSGAGPQVRVRWQVARDARFTRVVSSGSQTTGPARDHTVKVDAGGLSPATTYFYRFSYDGVHSPVGRTRTAPAHDADNARLRFGVASCANWQAGWFSAYRHLADRDDLEFVLHLGDYVYEYGPGEYGMGIGNVDVRRHDPPHEMVTLADYRRRHAQYKTDPDLRRLHARHPFVLTWDDHERMDNSWRAGGVNHDASEGSFAARSAAAYKAYDEWMPVRLSGTSALGDGTRIHRRLTFGRLAQLSLLDLRTYRDEQVALPVDSPTLDDPGRTITGDAQMSWLKRTLDDQHCLWRLVGNPVMIAPVRAPSLYSGLLDKVNQATNGTVPLPTDGPPYNTDQWDGYTADRKELYQHLRDQGVNNAVFLTGDIHSSWACDLPVDAAAYRLTGGSVGTEFVCTSVTSNNLKDITGTPPRTSSLAVEAAVTTANPHVKFLNFDDHGYAVVDITRRRLQVDYFKISARDDRKATSTRMASWATTVNSNKVHAVSTGVQG
ncbi:alkaline phosphatase D family protein [Nocardioides marmoribigeumensis]|uniref:Alkaline phosphatase D n=1 Tax=Nocardioides marmoribigeumensis TaxID=433649 RepID=A0ABU2BP98_9ACTN|nr:alkaline phosphatase D family protein [Nocardioides marmoribigeumensis]MDR7360450.1 alkaline phosphatase D [Nocardioides marmoribigeumensis]